MASGGNSISAARHVEEQQSSSGTHHEEEPIDGEEEGAAVGADNMVKSPSASKPSSTTALVTPIVSGNDPSERSGVGEDGGVGEVDSALDNQYFFEDEIFRIDKKGRVRFGLVIETSETYSGDEDDDFDDVLMKGEVRVAWYPEGREDVQPEVAIALADRTLMPGDVVRRLVPGKDTQRGYCREINMHADVKVLGTKYVLKNVITERLRPINNWQRDSAVCLDSWVGSTKDVDEKAVLRASSGARVEISSSDFYAFSDFNSGNSRGIYNPHVFYPGNVVIGRLPSLETTKLLTPNIPVHKNRKGKPFKGKYTIESVETDSVWVHWQCKALSEKNNIQTSLLEQPNPCVTGEDLKRLKRLNLFESCMLQISDRNYLKYSKYDTIVKKSQWDKEQGIKFKLILAQQQKGQSLSVCSHNSNNANNSALHHFEKSKKKLSQLDVDKSNKSKKFTIKTGDKQSSTASKEKPLASESCSGQGGAINTNSAYKSALRHHADGWVTDEDDEDDYYEPDSDEDAVSTTTCSSPSPHGSPKHVKRRLLRKKSSTNIKKMSSKADFAPKDGDELVTEALLVYSTATVVWQDGSIETGIPSTQLYPIHHLDNHEFFPGDFVISGKEDGDVSYRDYGVIQTVDHHGRTARVKWFTTYTSADEPKPTYKGESEVSVYDLKDHPDFQYRPGTMVIRVANFVGEDANCTAGQIIDNYIDGRAKVWWVDGHISMCWPQDLFEVGQYDHADWGHDSEDSWETESENSELGGCSPKLSMEESHIISNIERARVAIARLEEIFNISPNLQSPDVMRKLLTVFKGCRYLDRLLNTSFFHEDNFMGLIERVRKGGSQTISERAQDRKNRLFSHVEPTSPNSKPLSQTQQHPHQHQSGHYQAIVAVNTYNGQKIPNAISNAATSSSKEYAPKILINISSTPFKCSPSCANTSGTNVVASGDGGTGIASQLPSLKRKSTVSIAETAASVAYTVNSAITTIAPIMTALSSKATIASTATALSSTTTTPSTTALNAKSVIEPTTTAFDSATTKASIAALDTATSRIATALNATSVMEPTILDSATTKASIAALDTSTSNVDALDSNTAATTKSSTATCELIPQTSTVTSDTITTKTSSAASNAVTAAMVGTTMPKSEDRVNSKSKQVPSNLYNLLTTPTRTEFSTFKQNAYISEKNQLLISAMLNIEKAFEKTSMLKAGILSSQDDSGNYSRNENCDGSSSYGSSSDLTNADVNGSLTKCNDDQQSISCSSIELNEDATPELVCVRLCSLLKEQLVKCINEIREKYYKEDNLSFSDIFDCETLDGENSETIVEIKNLMKSYSEEAKEALTLPKSPDATVLPEITTEVWTVAATSPPPALTATAPLLAAPLTAPTVPLVVSSSECFQVLPAAPKAHKFHLTIFHPNNAHQYYRAVQREHRMLKTSLPPGVWVRVFEDRMDLMSVMIEGPKNTPYEDGLFFFDIQLGREYPKSPPLCHYISYCSDRLNPNLYEDGKVCVSLLGTWTGRESEVWGPSSTLLQVIVSIQGLILVPEPYFNEAGYEKQKGSQQGNENSRMYNEMVIIKMVQATTKLLQQPPQLFRSEILEHYAQRGMPMYERISGWMELSKQAINSTTGNTNREEATAVQPAPAAALGSKAYTPPEFALVPASRGFCLTLDGLLHTFKSKLESLRASSEAMPTGKDVGAMEVE